jgi:acyl dehydratase
VAAARGPALRAFTAGEQLAFAALTGDWNPLHVGPAGARWSAFGGPVVHGVHLVLWALGCGAALARLGALRRLRARFARPLLIGEEAACEVHEREIRVLREDGRLACEIDVTLGPVRRGEEAGSDPPGETAPAPRERSFDDARDAEGEVPVGIDAALARTQVGAAIDAWGLDVAAALAATTRLVGMECPGRDSVYAGLELALGDGALAPAMRYRVERVDARFRGVRMRVDAGAATGAVDAMFR